MPEVDASMMDRGPVPGAIVTTLVAQADGNEGAIVTFGTQESTCALCGATDVPIGWSQGKMVDTEPASIHLYTPMWKAQVDASSDAISFGDTLEMAASGKVSRATVGSGNTVFGYAMTDAVADGYVLLIHNCCATATAATS